MWGFSSFFLGGETAENPRWLTVFLKGALPCAASRLEMVVVCIDPESQGLMQAGYTEDTGGKAKDKAWAKGRGSIESGGP